LAGGCRGCPFPCGSITNNAGKTLLYTTNPNPSLSAHIGRCKFWNWYDGSNPLPREKTVTCTQQPLASGAGQKGGCGQRLDVDGFTFPNDAYWVGVVRHGTGVWTKMPDVASVTCRKVFGQIICIGL